MVVGWEIVDLRRRRKEVVMRIVGMETMGVKEKEQYILGFGGDFLYKTLVVIVFLVILPLFPSQAHEFITHQKVGASTSFFFFLIIHDETKLLLFNSTPRFYLNPS